MQGILGNPRSGQFTPAEDLCLLEEFNSHKGIFLGKFSEMCNDMKKKSDMEKNCGDSEQR